MPDLFLIGAPSQTDHPFSYSRGVSLGPNHILSGIIEGITTLLGLEQLIQTTIEGLVEALGTTLIDPLLNAIGISLGTTKVEITGADQNNVQLLEYCGPEGC